MVPSTFHETKRSAVTRRDSRESWGNLHSKSAVSGGTGVKHASATNAALWASVALIQVATYRIAAWPAWLTALPRQRLAFPLGDNLPPPLMLCALVLLAALSAAALAFRAARPSAARARISDVVLVVCVVAALFSLASRQLEYVDAAVVGGIEPFDITATTLATWMWIWLSFFLWTLASRRGASLARTGVSILSGIGAAFGTFWGSWAVSSGVRAREWVEAVDWLACALASSVVVLWCYQLWLARSHANEDHPSRATALATLALGALVSLVGSLFVSDARSPRVWRWMEPFQFDDVGETAMWWPTSADDCASPPEKIVWSVGVASDHLTIVGVQSTTPLEVRRLRTDMEELMTSRGLPVPPFALVAEGATEPPNDLLRALLEGRENVYLVAPSAVPLESHVLRQRRVTRACVCSVGSASVLTTGRRSWRELVAQLWSC